MASCNKPYSVKSSNPKMSGSEKPKSYMGGGMIKSYQVGGMVTKPRKMSPKEFTRGMMEDPRKPGAAMRAAKTNIMGPQEKRKGPGEYTPQAWAKRQMEMAMPEQELRRKSSPTKEVQRGKVTIEQIDNADRKYKEQLKKFDDETGRKIEEMKNELTRQKFKLRTA